MLYSHTVYTVFIVITVYTVYITTLIIHKCFEKVKENLIFWKKLNHYGKTKAQVVLLSLFTRIQKVKQKGGYSVFQAAAEIYALSTSACIGTCVPLIKSKWPVKATGIYCCYAGMAR